MTEPCPPTQHPADRALQDAVRAELAGRRRWHLAFAPLVEARFESDEGAGRRRDLVLAGLIGLLVYLSFLLNDLALRREVLGLAVAARGSVALFGGGVLALIWYQRVPPAWRETLMASTVVVVMASAGLIFHHTQSAARLYDPFAFSLVFLAGNVAFPLRFARALLSSVLCLGVAAAFVLLDARLPQQAQVFAMALLSGTAVFTVQACHRIERSMRQSYLLRLREQLATQVAQRHAQTFAQLSQTDALTGLPNRRAFDAALAELWSAAARQDQWLALLVADIDNFKRYNDLYGHPAGDACLRQVATAMRTHLRSNDLIARLGGEEFAVLLPASTAAQARAAAERLRRDVEGLALPHGSLGAGAVVTVSLGLALARPQQGGTASDLVLAADAALYTAKHLGRNRWVQASNEASAA